MSFLPNYSQTETAQEPVGLLLSVYLWRFLGFIVTALVAYFICSSGFWTYKNAFFIGFVLLGLEGGLTYHVSTHIKRFGFSAIKRRATVIYFFFCILSGCIVSFFFSLFFLVLKSLTHQHIISFQEVILFWGSLNVFMFVGIYLYGFLSKREWSRWMSFCLGSVCGWIWVYISVKYLTLMLVSGVGVFIIAGLMAHDFWKIQTFNRNRHVSGKKETNHPIFVALMLHLDLINLLIAITYISSGQAYFLKHHCCPPNYKSWYLQDD